MFTMNKNTPLTIERAKKYIELYKTTVLPQLVKYRHYYECKNEGIMSKTRPANKACNRIATPWARYICTLTSGLFQGKPVTLESDNKELLSTLEYINKNNDHISRNQSIAMDCAKYGIAAEIIYVGEDKNIYFDKLNPETIIPIYSSSLGEGLLYVIRFWDEQDILTNETNTNIEIYSKTEITYYQDTANGMVCNCTTPHYFGYVPINIYLNNELAKSDIDGVIKLIDGYDNALSDTADFRSELCDSYFVYRNTNLEDDDLKKMKDTKIIQIEDCEEGKQSSVSWLNKDSNDTEAENYKNRLADDIKRFSFIADIESAKSHTTATSAKIGLMGIEQICADKESYFRKALLLRYEMILNLLNIKGESYDINDLTMTFVRNIPVDLSVIGDTIAKVAPFVSKETLLAQIPFVNDIDTELSRIKAESEASAYTDMLQGHDEVEV